MPDEDTIKVKSFGGLYDEQMVHMTFDIDGRRDLHWFRDHVWVNASLHFHCNSIVEQSGNAGPYGYVRFCEKCKLITCFHHWDPYLSYELVYDQYFSETLNIGKCIRCGLRIAMDKGWLCHPTERSRELIAEVLKEIYPDPEPSEGIINGDPTEEKPIYATTLFTGWTGGMTGPYYNGHWMPSSFYAELPVLVSRIIEKQGEEAAKEYIRECIKNGTFCNENALKDTAIGSTI
jgi:hypothetical protein